ncbi:MAG: aminotransferase class I/II-fold pyridoxal phosphate-dependent enzyme, partial [Dehalococcoidia bacterium]
PNLYSLAGGQGVLRCVTFSKTIATGLRVGWVQGRADFTEACVRMRFDMGSSPLMHRALAEFVGSGQWEEHIEKMRRIYAAKEDALSRGILNECEPYVRFQRPKGGFFLWVELLNGINAQRVAQYGAEEGVLVVPGKNFFADGSGTSYLRLAFSTEHPETLTEGARRLSRALARAAE